MVNSLSTFYRVDISATGMGGVAPADGFIDHTPVESYMQTGGPPATLANSLAKERANIRYKTVREQLGLLGNVYISNRVATGANANTAATTFSFTAESERGDSPLVTSDELNSGQTLSADAAIKRAIARAMIANVTNLTDYYDPTTSTAAGNATLAVRSPATTALVTAQQLTNTISSAETVITVTKIANT